MSTETVRVFFLNDSNKQATSEELDFKDYRCLVPREVINAIKKKLDTAVDEITISECVAIPSNRKMGFIPTFNEDGSLTLELLEEK